MLTSREGSLGCGKSSLFNYFELYHSFIYSREQLLQASNDQELCFADGEVGGVLTALSSSSSLKQPVKSRKYWAMRLYNFLSKVIELKSTVRDPKALEVIPN